MKRTPLARRTPLTVYTPLHRTGPLNPTSAKRRAANAVRTPVVNGLRAAQEGRCARCGRADMPVHGHERRGGSWRSQTMLRPECVLCPLCNGAVEDAPRVAAWTGWKISAKWPHDPALTPTQARALDGSVVEFGITDAGAA